MKKFEFNKEINYFEIDPLHLAAGLKQAKGKYANIRVIPMDQRIKNDPLNMDLLSGSVWIKGLDIHEDIPIPKDKFPFLERLVNLEEMTIWEFGKLDYSKFRKLRKLTLLSGTDLVGLEKISSLQSLYLGRWKMPTLPKSIGSISATELRISVADKLVSLKPITSLTHLEKLTLQYLPALKVGKEINNLRSLKKLHIEKCAWTDLSQLQLGSLIELFSTKLESIAFIKQLKNLDDLFFWECVDGDLTPVLKHPTLTKIYFTPEKKHYSHRLSELKRLLAAKHMPAGRQG